MGIYLNTKELEAMVGIQHLQKLVYTHGIRPYMDFATGIVGIKRGISWQSISEALYVEPAAGIKGGSPKDGNLITVKVNTEANHSHSDGVSKNAKGGTIKTDKDGTPPSVRDLKSSTSSENSALQDDDDKFLIFPKKLNDPETLAIRNLLKGFSSDMAQVMLDELAGHMTVKQINSPVGYFRTIVRDAKKGLFQPERALRVEAGRKNQLAIQKQIAESSAASLINKANLPDAIKTRKLRPSLVDVLKNSNKNEVTA